MSRRALAEVWALAKVSAVNRLGLPLLKLYGLMVILLVMTVVGALAWYRLVG